MRAETRQKRIVKVTDPWEDELTLSVRTQAKLRPSFTGN